jgi:2-methylcitrate dehydratase PrpD
MTVSGQLADFLVDTAATGVPGPARHEAARLLLNQLKASVAATDQPAVTILRDWTPEPVPEERPAHVLWLGTPASAERAAMINGALFEVLDFHDTYIPTYLHAVSAVLPAAMAAAEVGGHSGASFLDALALGIEAELACATVLMPTGYFRGFVPLGLVGGVGAAAACSVLAGLDRDRTRNALGLAMCTASGTYESVGSMALPYITALTARNGLNACELAAAGLDAPATAFEGDKGMLRSYSDEKADKIAGVMADLGRIWRIGGQSYKTMPTETITHAPLESVLALRARAGGREIARMVFGVAPIVVTIADERFERFGVPHTELEARFDLRYCAAAAWQRGRFTLAETAPEAFSDERILALRAGVELVADPERTDFDGCWLEISYTDGSADRIVVDAFAGSAARPLSDTQLSDVFRATAIAAGRTTGAKADAIAAAVFSLESAPSLDGLISLLTT